MHELNERLSRAVLAALFNPGLAVIGDLIDFHGPQLALDYLLTESRPAELDRLVTRALADHDIVTDADLAQLARDIDENTRAAGARIIAPGEDAWPVGLDDLTAYRPHGARWGAPWCLWVQGKWDLAIDPVRAVAFWGDRFPSEHGASLAAEAAVGLAQSGYHVIGNGETGIAQKATESAMRLGRALAIVAGGFNRTHLGNSGRLLEAVAERGTVYTAQPPGRARSAWATGYRDALLAASAATLVAVEVPSRSTDRSFFTTAQALDRTVLSAAHPHLIHKRVGNYGLEEAGAVPAASPAGICELVTITTA
ncbi:DNA-processing protein DprA [Glycomyces tenuis]|uniref:DNA-processing protein DprA n=1 Tax=Glycomyces tenuis TaxID=58116 RepID=UPI0004149148|nr:DNA-processing protein DprA [Glycomyces tenuis]